ILVPFSSLLYSTSSGPNVFSPQDEMRKNERRTTEINVLCISNTMTKSQLLYMSRWILRK
ncbi:MAG: hypothetical protein VX467_04755, partial [Verrucomicrobiota bacterium]|nr:hypothetical protein [Verrucomicrobiota bacterium]